MAAQLSPSFDGWIPYFGMTSDVGYKYERNKDNPYQYDGIRSGYYDTRPVWNQPNAYGNTLPDNLLYKSDAGMMDWDNPDQVSKWYDYEWGNTDDNAFFRTHLNDAGQMQTDRLSGRGGSVLESHLMNQGWNQYDGFASGGKPYDRYYPGMVHGQEFMPDQGHRMITEAGRNWSGWGVSSQNSPYTSESQYYNDPTAAMNNIYFTDDPVEGLEALHFTNWDNNGLNNWYFDQNYNKDWKHTGYDMAAAFNDLYLDSENQYRREQERDYNNLLNKYTSELSDIEKKAMGFGDTLSGININNVQDNQAFLDQLLSTQARLENIDLDTLMGYKPRTGDIHGFFDRRYENMKDNTPRFRTALDAYDPNVRNVGFDQKTLNTYIDDLVRAQNRFKSIQSDRNAAVSRDDAFRGRMGESIEGYWSNAEDEDIYGNGILDMLGSQYGDLQNQFSTYKSDLKNPGFGDIQSELGEIGGWLGEQNAAYDTEADRINQFRTGMQTRLGDLGESVEGTTIRDAGAIESLDQDIAAALAQAEGFNTPISTDFSDITGALGGLDSRVDALRSRRESELDRVNQARTGFGESISGLMERAPELNLRAGSQFDSANAQIEDLRNRIGGFESELDPDMTDLLDQLLGAEQAVQSRYQERRGAIDEILGRAQDFGQSARDTDLWNEQAMLDAIAGVEDTQSELGLYTGGRTAQDMASTNDIIEAINSRLGQLGEHRGDIENRAQQLLGQAQETPFYGMDDVQRMRGLYDPLAGESGQYKATQAQDELDAILGLITGEESRIQGDLARLEQRRAEEQAATRRGVHGLNRDLALGGINIPDLSAEEFQALVSRARERDEGAAQQLLSQYGRLFG
jgi:hypothetical protein